MNLGRFELDKIYNEDCYKAIKDIPDKSIDLIVTDPPYLIESTNGGLSNNLGKSIRNMNEQLKNGVLTCGINKDILKEYARVLKNINIYIWCNHKQIPLYLDYFVNELGCNFDILIWHKTNAVPLFCNKYLTDKEYCLYFRKGGYCNPKDYESAKTIYEIPINVNDKNKFEHPTIKPIKIIKNLIENSSRRGGVVLDTFMGSGTTAVACKNTERHFIGFEIDKHWWEIANDRLNNICADGQMSLFTM